MGRTNTIVSRLHAICALCAGVATLSTFALYWAGMTLPCGLTDLILAPGELFVWLVFTGDDADSLLQLYTLGLPFAVLFNGALALAVGYVIRFIILKSLSARNFRR